MTDSDMAALQAEVDTLKTAWLGTCGSQVFVMQLGFLLFETGMVDPIWASSIIVKNVEDTFVGLMAFITFSWTLSIGSGSVFHAVGSLRNAFLVGVPASMHEEVFVYAVYATTTATIMSGCILHRMKNRGYIVWCFLVVCINYSVVAHWTWNEDSWLRGLGFVDAAGAAAVHITGGVCGLVAVVFLGMRQDAMDYETGELKEETASPRPVLVAMGTMLLWYGWFAFHLASPIAGHYDVGGRMGTIVLNTCVAPAAASLSAYLIMELYLKKTLKFEALVSCTLAGLVSITASNSTTGVWQAFAIGFFAAPVYFTTRRMQRSILLDDPLNIGPIHLWPAVYALIMEGVFADGTIHRHGLVYGGFGHFGVQVLGVVCILLFNFVMAVVLYQFMSRVLFRNSELRVSALDNYLGTNLFEVNSKLAFETLVEGRTYNARKLLFDFHRFAEMSYVSELLDFAVAVNEFKKLCADLLYEDPPVFDSDSDGPPPAAQTAKEQRLATIGSRSTMDEDGAGGVEMKSPTASARILSALRPKKHGSKDSKLLDMFRAAMSSADTPESGRFDPAIAFFKSKTVFQSGGQMAAAFWERLPPRTQASVQEKIVHSCVEALTEQFVVDFAPQCVNLPYLVRKQCTQALTQCKALDRVLTDAMFFDRVVSEAKRMLSPVFFQFLVVINPETKPKEVERILASLATTKAKKFEQTVSNRYINAQVPYVIDTKWRIRWDEELLHRRTLRLASIGSDMGSALSHMRGIAPLTLNATESERLRAVAAKESGAPNDDSIETTAIIIANGVRAGPYTLQRITASVELKEEEVVIEMPPVQ